MRVPKQCDRGDCTTRQWEPLFVNATLLSEQKCQLANFAQNIYPISICEKKQNNELSHFQINFIKQIQIKKNKQNEKNTYLKK